MTGAQPRAATQCASSESIDHLGARGMPPREFRELRMKSWAIDALGFVRRRLPPLGSSDLRHFGGPRLLLLELEVDGTPGRLE